MIVCPACRHVNEEDAQRCARCGRTLEPGPTTFAPQRRPSDAPPAIEIATPRPPSRWRPVVVIGGLALALAAAGAFVLFRPDPCEGTNFSSEAFGYCLEVPDGWIAEPATFGADVALDQFAPPERPTTVIVDASDLEESTSLEEWAGFIRRKDADAGLTPGPASETVVDGVTAQQWDVSATSDSGAAYRMREVVLVRDEVGWRITLNDTEDAFDVSVVAFERMLESWRFR